MEKLRVILIGLGRIARHHAQALMASDRYELCGVCDLNRERAADLLYQGLPFSTDFDELISSVCPDAAVIATPPQSHVQIAKRCVQRGLHVFVEKPLSDSADGCEWFLTTEAASKCTAICHSIYGEEVLWFEQNMRLSSIDQIYIQLSDPYLSADGSILADRLSLGGAWLDSGPNALALLSRFVNLTTVSKVSICHEKDTLTCLPVKTVFRAMADTTALAIDIRWTTDTGSKQYLIQADGHEYLLDSSRQAVCCDGKLLFQSAEPDRLTAHYSNFYRLYPRHQPTEQALRSIYELLEKGKN